MTLPLLDRHGVCFAALLHIERAGGRCLATALEPVMLSHFRSATRLQQIVLGPLQARGFVQVADSVVTITPSGQRQLPLRLLTGRSADADPAGTTLDLQRFYAGGPQRVGSTDFRAVPSLMAGVRVPHWWQPK